jgi:nicotinate-nucleotide--dimethylbenzimidazole phosphoribosyltransferase
VNDAIAWFTAPAPHCDAAIERAARERQNALTKPPGSLGRLEDVAVRLAAMQRQERPSVDRVQITVFAADHGVACEGVSAFPQAVTAEMIKNFANGGAAVCVLAAALDAALEIVDLGTVIDAGSHAHVHRQRLGPGTANMALEPAMNDGQLAAALRAGRDSVDRALARSAQLFIGGDMGIGNTTAAAALACALLGAAPPALAGRGTGLDDAGVARKADVIDRALNLHARHLADPVQALRCVGGFEIAALAGAYIACARGGLPVLVDGFIASVAALAASRLCAGSGDWFLFAHRSAEAGHARVLEALSAQPLLDLGMRLGEGSGAAVAVPLLRLACELHNGMATFAEAGVSGKL